MSAEHKPSDLYELRAAGWYRYTDGSGPYFVDSLGVATPLPGSGVNQLVVHHVATNGEIFPEDSATVYGYDGTGLNIETITKTTVIGTAYRQTWTRGAESQLATKTGWVRVP